MPAGDRDLVAGQPFGRGRVVVEDIAYVAGLPRGIAPGVAGVAHLQLGQLLDVLVDEGGEAAQQPGLLARCDVAPGGIGLGGPLDRGVGLLQRRQVDVGDLFFGRRIHNGVRGAQFVSLESFEAAAQLPVGHGGVKAASSTSAMLV